MLILVLSDIHANVAALEAVEKYFGDIAFDRIINCGDSVVYGPHPNETLSWLASRNALSILGNTDKKVLKLLRGTSFAKPSNPEKRIMYTWTADQLSGKNRRYLQSLSKKEALSIPPRPKRDGESVEIGIYHGSPARNHEFLFNTTPDDYFQELAALSGKDVVLCGHSHDPFHKVIEGCHFINPGSIGRMFDGDPRPSCAVLRIDDEAIDVEHHRVSYDVEKTIAALRQASLPGIYCEMFRTGRKTN